MAFDDMIEKVADPRKPSRPHEEQIGESREGYIRKRPMRFFQRGLSFWRLSNNTDPTYY